MDGDRPGNGATPGEPAAVAVRAGERMLNADDLEYINRMTTVGHVLPNVAHELNNALQVVGGLVEMLAARADLPPEVRDKVGRIGTQAGRASTLLRDLVVYTRKEDAGVRTVDLGRLIDRVLSMRRYQLSRAKIGVVVEGTGPPGPLVRADGHALQQALLNLLINAEHGVTGRDGAEVRVTVVDAAERVEVRVRDNGTGLAAGLPERAVAAFVTTKTPAAGLGLTVAALLVGRQGGELELHGLADGGAEAVMMLPKPRPTD